MKPAPYLFFWFSGLRVPPVEMGCPRRSTRHLRRCDTRDPPECVGTEADPRAYARGRGHRGHRRILRHPENWPVPASPTYARRGSSRIASPAGEGCDRGRQGRRCAAPRCGRPSLPRSRSRKDLLTSVERALDALETIADSPRADPGQGGGAAARDQPRHELPGAPHPRARGLRRPPRPRLLRPRRQGPRRSRAMFQERPRRRAEPSAPALKRLADEAERGRLPRDPARRRGRRRRGRRGLERRCTSRGSSVGFTPRRPRVRPRQGAPGRHAPTTTIDDYLRAAAPGGADPAHPGRAARDQGRPGGGARGRRGPRPGGARDRAAAASPRRCATRGAPRSPRSASRRRRSGSAPSAMRSPAAASWPPRGCRAPSPRAPGPAVSPCAARAGWGPRGGTPAPRAPS